MSKRTATIEAAEQVDIQPEMAIYRVFRHLNYKAWFALAELVDNALQSFLTNRKELERVEGKGWPLRVEIEIERGGSRRIVVRDYAAGISAKDWQRALKAGAAPVASDVKLSEFGVGLKTAASWFAKRWTLRSAALGENVVRQIDFDVDDIVARKLTSLEPKLTPKDKDEHFTEVILNGIHHGLPPQTIAKVKRHLASIYRFFLRDGDLEIVIDGEELVPEEPSVLIAAPFENPKGTHVAWRKDINIQVGAARVHGSAWILAVGATGSAGFSLFRGRRLIQGSGDEKYRPYEIFKNPNSYLYQRLSGELTVEGIDVSHTKDGFRWGDQEEEFLSALEAALDEPPLPLLRQARGHRSKVRSKDLQDKAQETMDTTARVLEEHANTVIGKHASGKAETDRAVPPPTLPRARALAQRDIKLDFHCTKWSVRLELVVDPAVSDFYTISRRATGNGKDREIGVRVSMDHPFVNQFSVPDQSHVEPLFRVAIALALAETVAREANIRDPGEVRIIVNDLLRNALWQPGE
jgi:hypothetical protein